MDRVARVTLLLELVDPQTLRTALREYAPERLDEYDFRREKATVTTQNPYRGLAAFQQDEAHLFFGREALTSQLWQRFEALHETPDATRLLAILGPSGSGKSSVARAGLLAALALAPIPGPDAMHIVIVKPGGRPIESLSRALLPLLSPEAVELSTSRQVAVEKLLTDREIFAQGLRRLAADLPNIEDAPLLLFVDQFEELYTLCKDPAERDLFVELILHAASDASRHVSIVLTLRSDFLGELQRHHNELSRVIAEQEIIVPPLSPDELRDAIVRPAEQAGHPIDPATVELLLTEARGSQGALPLLAFALSRIFEGMLGGAAPGDTLRKLGGVGGALAGEAQKIYESLHDADRATARRAIVRLVRLGEGTRDTRRRVPIAELCGLGETEADVLSILRRFAAENARLVTLSGAGSETLAEVTHEALFDHWTELRSWIDQSRADRSLHDRTLEAAKLWNRDGRPAGRLWQAPDLDLLRDYQQRKPDEFGALLTAFLSAAQRRQKRERLFRVGTTASVVVALLGAITIYAVKERQRSQLVHDKLVETYIERGAQNLFEGGNPSEGLLWIHRARDEGSQDPALPQLLRSAMQPLDLSKATLIGHTLPVWSGEWSPDGKRVVTASLDTTARVWDVQSGRQLVALKGATNSVWDARWSPDGRRIATSGANKPGRVFDADSGRLLFELQGHTDSLNSIEWRFDGQRLLTSSLDGTARIWDAETGRAITELRGSAEMLHAAFSRDGRRIVTAGQPYTAAVWDASSGQLIAELRGHGQKVTWADFSPDGQLVATGSADSTARLWDSETGRLITELRGHREMIDHVTFSPDGRRVVTGSADNLARVWDVPSGHLLLELRGHREAVYRATYSPDGLRIITASLDSTARVWDAVTGLLLTELRGHRSHVTSATFSPDQQAVFTTSQDHTARLWRLHGGRLVAELRGHTALVRSAEWSPDGKRVVTASYDATARVFDAEDGRFLFELPGSWASVRRASFSPDGARIVTASMDKNARIYDAADGQLLVELKGHRDRLGLRLAQFSPDGSRVLTCGTLDTMRIFDAQTGQSLREMKVSPAEVQDAAFSPDGRSIVAAGSDRKVRIFDAESGQLRRELTGHALSIYKAAYSHDGRSIVSVSQDFEARIWDAESGALRFRLRRHNGTVFDADFDAGDRRVATAGSDRTACIWDAKNGALLADLKGHGDRISQLAFSPDGSHLVTASDDGTARVWESASGRVVAELRGHGDQLLTARWSPDGRRIVTTSYDKTARIWDLTPETRSREALDRRIRCDVPVQFESPERQIIIPRKSTPDECAGLSPND